MSDLRKAAQQALEGLCEWRRFVGNWDAYSGEYSQKTKNLIENLQKIDAQIANLRAALEAPEVEPVALIGTNGELAWIHRPKVLYSKPVPLYA